MRGYLFRRLLLAVLTLFGISLIVAGVMRTLPGDVVDVLAAEAFYNESEKERLREELGLEAPFLEYFGDWLVNAVQGDFGKALRTQRSVGSDLVNRIDVTIELAFLGILIATLLSVPMGIVAALQRSRWPDYTARSIAVFALAIPGFWLATLAIVFGAKWFAWSPPLGYQPIWEAPLTNLQADVAAGAVVWTDPGGGADSHPADGAARCAASGLHADGAGEGLVEHSALATSCVAQLVDSVCHRDWSAVSGGAWRLGRV